MTVRVTVTLLRSLPVPRGMQAIGGGVSVRVGVRVRVRVRFRVRFRLMFRVAFRVRLKG